MVVWLASYPRSGNTFLRIVLHQLFAVPTYSVYDDDDPVAQRVGTELVGYLPKPASTAEMMASETVYFLKTHKRRKADRSSAIYLVRDGRDAVISHARLRHAMACAGEIADLISFEELVRAEITRPYVDGQPSSGTWGGNALSWLGQRDPAVVVVRFEELIANPLPVVSCAVSMIVPCLAPIANPIIPSFEDLSKRDASFFRRGVTGAYRDELTDECHDLFWLQPENRAAMELLGYKE